MNLWKSLAGQVVMELTSADPERSVSALSQTGIELLCVRPAGDLCLHLTMSRSQAAQALRLCEKRGDQLKPLAGKGLYWTGKGLLKRPVLLLSLVVLLLATVMLPGRTLFLQVEGNDSVPSRRILEAAETAGLQFGAVRREIRSEQIKNALLEAIPELQWVGVNTSGCRAVISVRERPQEQQEQSASIRPVVAVRDALVTSCTVTRGNALCAPGQAVKEGQVLISPYTDCGRSIRITAPEGEILGLTSHEIRAVQPAFCLETGEITARQRRYSVILGKKRINLWKDSGIWDATCGRMYAEYYLTLPGGFQLPVRLGVETLTRRIIGPGVLPEEHCRETLTAFARSTVSHRMISGRILSQTYEFAKEDGLYCLEVVYGCEEMIGRVGKIGDANEQNS